MISITMLIVNKDVRIIYLFPFFVMAAAGEK